MLDVEIAVVDEAGALAGALARQGVEQGGERGIGDAAAV